MEVNSMEKYGRNARSFNDYIGINYSIVWDVVENKIPELNDQIEEILSKE
jgi:uncharacterized protein with HEPN domain